jgi:uncharacterized protein
VVLDVLRGLALLGVLVANVALIAAPARETALSALDDAHPLDAAAEVVVAVLVTGKFYPLFALLFGIGLALQLGRPNGVRLVGRRLSVLLVIGLAHALLVWTGDILIVYALLGALVVAAFRRRSSGTLARWAIVLLAGPALFAGGAVAGAELARVALPAFDAEMAAEDADATARIRREAARLRTVYGDGSYADTLADRVTTTPAAVAGGVGLGLLSVLPAMLLGVILVRHGLPAGLPARSALLRRVRRWGLRVGLPLNVAAVTALYLLGPRADAGLLLGVLPFAGSVLALGYGATVALAVLDRSWAARLMPLAPVGRLALTNYLLGSVVATTIFSGYGLGLYDRVGAAAQVVLALLLFGLQVLLSGWWVRRFRFGPAEWLWRSATYGRRQPFRLAR